MGVIDDYIATFDGHKQQRLNQVYQIIKAAAPELKEKISWGMPTFYLKHNVIHFAGQRGHVGIYPGMQAIVHFAKELEGYKSSKGGFQIPYSREPDAELIRNIVAFNLSLPDQSKIVR